MDEVAFDDFIGRDALIVSPMNPSMTNNCLAGAGNCYGEMNDGVKVVGSQGLPTKMSTQTWFYGLWIDPTVTSSSQTSARGEYGL